MKAPPEVIVIDDTDDDMENTTPNGSSASRSTTTPSVSPPSTVRAATLAAPPAKAEPKAVSHATSAGLPARAKPKVPPPPPQAQKVVALRSVNRPLTQLQICTVTGATVQKKRRAEVPAPVPAQTTGTTAPAAEGNRRDARQSTTEQRPLYRPGRLLHGHMIPRPPPLRPSRSARALTLDSHTHIVGADEEHLEPARSPWGLPTLGDQFNPDGILFQDVPSGKMCSCTHPCRVDTCYNAQQHLFCTSYCCPFGGLCGNGLEPSRCLGLMQNSRTNDFTVVATNPIDKHVVVGEYLGRLTKETFKPDERPQNGGYRLYMHHDPEHPVGVRICIDAEVLGNMLRFVNHSCFANARFRQVCNGTEHTVVIVTTKRLDRGAELLVDYGPELWFYCRCGGKNCRHQGFAKYNSDADDEMDEEVGVASVIREAVRAGAMERTYADGESGAAAKSEGSEPSRAAAKSEDGELRRAAAKSEAAKSEDGEPRRAAAKSEDSEPRRAAAKSEGSEPRRAAAKSEDGAADGEGEGRVDNDSDFE